MNSIHIVPISTAYNVTVKEAASPTEIDKMKIDIYYILNGEGKEEMLKHSRYVRTQPEYKKRDNNEKMA
ncbi:MAG: hypothetical protein RSF40_08330 [Oscillospiraceae bacterium]